MILSALDLEIIQSDSVKLSTPAVECYILFPYYPFCWTGDERKISKEMKVIYAYKSVVTLLFLFASREDDKKQKKTNKNKVDDIWAARSNRMNEEKRRNGC